MNREKFDMQRLTEITCRMNCAKLGFACNKTVFLLQEHEQLADGTETWTTKNWENDRFGLLNGVLYLLKQTKSEQMEIYFPKYRDVGEVAYVKFDKDMTFTEVSRIIDRFYTNGYVIYK